MKFNMGDSHSGRKRSLDDDDPSGKKKKNREAARKCRENKAAETEKLKQTNEELMKKNNELNGKKVDLERKLTECIEEIKKHKSSGCILPQNVATIIDSFEDFIPVGTQTKPIQSNGIHSNGPQTNGHNTHSNGGEMFQIKQNFSPEPQQQTVQGLFSGIVLPANAANRTRHRNPSSRSSSRSQSPSVNSYTRKTPSPSSQCTSSSKNINTPNRIVTQPSWTALHQQTFNGVASPALSPAQTVPNIDSDWQMVPSVTPQKQNGFSDIDEAVQLAQKDPGVMEDVVYQNHAISSPLVPRVSTLSMGFVPNSVTPTSSVSSWNYTVEERGTRNPSPVVSVFNDTLKPASSSSLTVSMNHTAELVSQALSNNFDASEISEDLKNQYVQLAKSQENKNAEPDSQRGQTIVQNEQFPGEENRNVVEADQTQLQSSINSTSEMSYAEILKLAKDQEQGITVQYQGREYYNCSYEQIQQIFKYMSGQNTTVENNDTPNNEIDLTLSQQSYYPETPATQEIIVTNDLLNPAYSYTYTPQSQDQIFTQSYSANNQIIVPTSPQPISEPTPIQTTQLPTTVLSMIQEESSSPTAPPMEPTVESMDYSDNVRDLPSLSLTEDDTNIFEKRRKL